MWNIHLNIYISLQFHFVSFAICHEKCVTSTCGFLWYEFDHARTQTHTNAYILLLMRTFKARAEQQLNHSNQADQFSCKLQVTSLRSHISAAFLILSMVDETSVCHSFSFNETKTCFSVSDVFLIRAAYNKVYKGQLFYSVKNSHNLDVCKTKVGVRKLESSTET